MELIDKASVVAEIKKIYNEDYKFLPSDLVESVQDFKDDLLRALDTLEVKEVDIEKEKDDYWNKLCDDEFGELLERDTKWFDDIAEYFFELGLKERGLNKDYKKAYQEALERARDLMTKQNPSAFDKHLIEIVFPELKEESENERMKFLIKSCVYASDTTPEGRKEIFDWLEKQGN